MADIFISYKSERRNAARHFAKVLACYGYDVWYDYGLIPGDDYERRLLRELDAAKAVLVLWCGLGVSSDWVRKEAGRAKHRGTYLPCWIESAKLPDEFARNDTINLITWDGAPRTYMLDRLLLDLARRLGRDPTPDFRKLVELEEDWRGYGAPALSQFALGAQLSLRSETAIKPSQRAIAPPLGRPPTGITAYLIEQWDAAQRGETSALSIIGWNFERGTGGLPCDDREAVRFFRLAADQGDAIGQASLGFMYVLGRGGLQRNDYEATRLFKLAADQGNALGQDNLGVMHSRGAGGLQANDREAAKFFKLAADQGDAGGQVNLGSAYERGLGGLPQNDNEAARLYRLSADQEHAHGQANLGFMYASGRGGLAQDMSEAVRLFRLAADQGDARGQAYLGLMCEKGYGTTRDESEAIRLYKLALQGGHEEARAALRRLGVQP